MAGWLLFGDGVPVEDSGRAAGVLNDENRGRFEGHLEDFLRSVTAYRSFLPLPPMLGNGHHVDLYKLFLVVKGKGGYDAVSNGKLWDLVGEESGLGVSVGHAVKLVYSKYLGALEAWSKTVAESKVPPERGLVDDRDKFGKQLMELQTDATGLISYCVEDKVEGRFDDENVVGSGGKLGGANGVEGFGLESNGDDVVRNGGCVVSDSRDCLGDSGNGNDAMEIEESDGGGMLVDAEQTVDISDVASNDRGEKCDNDGDGKERESLWTLLNWVRDVAKNPCDPAVGYIPDKSKWRSCSNEELWKQVLSFREAAFIKRPFETNNELHNWQNQRMHPCLYDDQLGTTYNLRERLKRDKKHLSETSSFRNPSDSSSDRTPSPRAEKQSLNSSYADKVGPAFQAKIPEWSGETSESDSKWLGTLVWPSKAVNSRFLIERDPIGKGRQDTCGCPVPGSVECVRFHIAEKKAKVKLELGAAFYEMNLDKAGEDIRQLWTEEEEKVFEHVVKSNPPSQDKYFWDHIFKTFPKKSRADLVSYYFNVYLLQRRAYQNRHTPNDIESDDEESEFGPLRNVFGNQTQDSRSSILLTPKKKQKKGK